VDKVLSSDWLSLMLKFLSCNLGPVRLARKTADADADADLL